MSEQVIGGKQVPVGGTYTCPDCKRVYQDVEEGEVVKPCQSDDCPQHWELQGKEHPANDDAYTTIQISNVNKYDGRDHNRPLTLAGLDGGGEVVIWFGDKTGPDQGRIFIEATPDGYFMEIYKGNDEGGNSLVEVKTSPERMEIEVDGPVGGTRRFIIPSNKKA